MKASIPIVILCLMGCTGYVRSPLRPEQVIEQKNPDVVAITTRSTSRIVLFHPEVRNGILLGDRMELEGSRRIPMGRFSIPVEDIESLEVREFRVVPSVIAGSLLAAGLAAVLYLRASATR